MNDLQTYVKKLIYKSNHRGSKEMDILLGKFASKYIHVPFVILGGAGKFDDFIQANKVNKEVSLGAANIFHFTEHSILNAKKFLSQSKMNVRTF